MRTSTKNQQDDDAKQSIATLLLVARGRLPSWKSSTQPMSSSPSNPTMNATIRASANSTTRSRNPPLHDDSGLSITTVFYIFVIATCAKVLLFPAYHSTDLYVHRHWKAVTQQLHIAQWYYDDRFVATRHTLDYPPGFMLLEWCLAKVTRILLSINISNGATDSNQHCLSLIPDSQLESSSRSLSLACIASLRTTVIVSDTVLWFSAYVISQVIQIHPSNSTNHTNDARKQGFAYLLFGLFAFHPALLWLDHVHFQYNGCLMGILMLSLACLMHANNPEQRKGDAFLHCMAAALFAILLSLKHLYLTCSLWYLVYLLRRYCFNENSWYSGIQRLLLVAIVSGTVFAIPFLVFYLSLEKEDRYDWIIQVFTRLFPFQRGLVHDYWAGNIWALYVAIIKVARFLLLPFLNDAGMDFLRWLERDAVTPGVSGVCLLIGQLPGLRLAIVAAARRSNVLLLHSFVYVTLVSFLFQYHAHEKAIITALFPATLWAALAFQSKDDFNAAGVMSASSIGMFIQVFTALALLGLFPLLFRPEELLFKVTSFVGFIAALQYFVSSYIENKPVSGTSRRACIALYCVVTVTAAQLDVLPVQRVFGRYEFAPLAITSLICAVGNMVLFAQVLIWTMRANAKYA